MDRDTHNEKKYSLITLGAPAFAPTLLHLFFWLDIDSTYLNHFLHQNIEIFKRILDTKKSTGALGWGYLFSIIYLIAILPYMTARTKRTIFFHNKNKMKATWLLLSICFFLGFLFMNFIDLSSGSAKYAAMIELSFYFWPLFYFFFLFPLYLSLAFLLAFVNTKIK